jgi:choline dehydrogenase
VGSAPDESLTALAEHPLRKGLYELLRYQIFGTGLLSMPILPVSLFVRSTSLNEAGDEYLLGGSKQSEEPVAEPKALISDIELMPVPANTMDITLEESQRMFPKIGIFSIIATLLQPKSRGTVRLRSANPHDRPKVDCGLLSDPLDLEILRKAVRLSLKSGDKMRSAGFPMQRTLDCLEDKLAQDAENNNTEMMDDFIRRRARPTFHFGCSCRMASRTDDESPGVADDELKVHGVTNLRVCDASVFPEIISSHLQASEFMVAERCADFIKRFN